ncbi:MAG: phosphoglycerate mutase family protein [Candidatus Izemoplasmatales bacterium]|nr:phosphoglycerate mutase family protein [Candidatus Izemoplasmatales bacterium]
MRLIYIRHGEPTYEPDGLTELGKQQAEKIAQHLSLTGVDRIFSSTSNRAIMTAMPTSKRLNKEIAYLDFANEKHVWRKLTIDTPTGKCWLFQSHKMIELFHRQDMIDLGLNWVEHPEFSQQAFKEEMDRIQKESDQFFASLGYLHLGNSKYKVVDENDDRVAVFAHQGFGYAFLSLLLNIPYPQFCTHFELGHAEITLIEFKNEEGYSYPKVLSLSNRCHLDKEI